MTCFNPTEVVSWHMLELSGDYCAVERANSA